MTARRVDRLMAALAVVVGAGLVVSVTVLRDPPDRTSAIYLAGIDRLDRALGKLDTTVARGDAAGAQKAFRETRAAYKRIELFIEYYGSFAVRELNGPPIPHPEDEDPETPLPAVGLQMIEAELFAGGLDSSRIAAARRRCATSSSLHHTCTTACSRRSKTSWTSTTAAEDVGSAFGSVSRRCRRIRCT